MHFAEATEDMKLAMVEAMQLMPFQGYVAFARLDNNSEYQSTYLKLLKSMIKRRLMASESKLCEIFIEQNSKVQQQFVRKLIAENFTSLQMSNNRHPLKYSVNFVAKPNNGISIPDFLLGVLGKNLADISISKQRQISRNNLMFERIRDKYRLIKNLDSGEEYSRRNPIKPW